MKGELLSYLSKLLAGDFFYDYYFICINPFPRLLLRFRSATEHLSFALKNPPETVEGVGGGVDRGGQQGDPSCC